MRKLAVGIVVAIGIVSAVVGFMFAGSARPKVHPESEDVLFLRTSAGITLVRASSQAVTVRLPDAVPSTDWSTLVRAVARGKETRVEAFDASSGDPLWSRDVAGRFEVKVVSTDGRQVALGPRNGGGYYRGRSSTTLVILGSAASVPRRIELEGNYAPEAFTVDGENLFVIEYLPPTDPNRYRVRRLDLRTKKVIGVYTVDAKLQEAMQGTARVQAASPDGRRLYTLYTLEGPDGTRRAFVHVLSLDELWAHCVDLPAAFETASEEATAISLTPDGRRVYVADAYPGTVAEIDTEKLTVTRTAEVPFAWRGGNARATVGPDGTLYLAKGMRLVALDTSTLAPGRSWNMEERITGLQASTDGERLYVGSKNRIVILDTGTGKNLGVLDPANLGTIRQLGQSTRSLDEERTLIECAC